MIQKNLINIKSLPLDHIEGLFQKAKSFKKGQKVPFFLPKNPFLGSIFLEPSTRTKVSFEIAAQNLGLKTLYLSNEGSSLEKGETLEDTVLNLKAMGVELFCIRLKEENVLDAIAANSGVSIVNAGSGVTSHPSQALLDFFTIQEYFPDLNSIQVAYVGDIEKSRVVSSHKEMQEKLGFQAHYISIQDPQAEKKLDQFLPEADVVYLLRVQEERWDKPLLISKQEYNTRFGLNPIRFKNLKPSSIVMHPGPFIPDKEISVSLLKESKVKILRQVENSIPIRMAILASFMEENL